MNTETGRWLAPLASAATVGTMILGMSQLGGGAAGRPVPDRRVPTPTGAATQALDFSGMAALRRTSRRNAVAAPVRLDGYTTRGRVLTLRYTITVRGCSSRIARPEVVESGTAVTVALRRLPPPAGKRQVCPEISLADSVDVTLRVPLGHRVVRDGGRAGSSVPLSGAAGATYPPSAAGSR